MMNVKKFMCIIVILLMGLSFQVGAMDNNEQEIELIAKGGVVKLKIRKDVAENQSDLIKGMLEEQDEEEDEDIEIPVPNIDAKMLPRIIVLMNEANRLGLKGELSKEESYKLIKNLSELDIVSKRNVKELFDLINAANYLNAQYVLDALVIQYARLLGAKGVAMTIAAKQMKGLPREIQFYIFQKILDGSAFGFSKEGLEKLYEYIARMIRQVEKEFKKVTKKGYFDSLKEYGLFKHIIRFEYYMRKGKNIDNKDVGSLLEEVRGKLKKLKKLFKDPKNVLIGGHVENITIKKTPYIEGVSQDEKNIILNLILYFIHYKLGEIARKGGFGDVTIRGLGISEVPLALYACALRSERFSSWEFKLDMKDNKIKKLPLWFKDFVDGKNIYPLSPPFAKIFLEGNKTKEKEITKKIKAIDIFNFPDRAPKNPFEM